jgi:hypothetical protein
MFRYVQIDLCLQFLIYVGEVLSAHRISYFETERHLLLDGCSSCLWLHSMSELFVNYSRPVSRFGH